MLLKHKNRYLKNDGNANLLLNKRKSAGNDDDFSTNT